MNDHSTTYQVTCLPSRNAGTAATRGPGRRQVLMVYLDSVKIAIQLPPLPGGDVVLAEFCRELAWEAAKFAAEIDPDGEPIPPDRSPGYMVILGSSGGGC